MKINIVSNIDKGKDWSFNRMAYALQSYIDSVVVSKEPLLGDFDVVHCFTFTPHILNSEAKYKVAHVTSSTYLQSAGYAYERITGVVRLLDIVDVGSNIMADWILEMGIPKSKVKIIRHPVDLNKFKIRIRIGIVAQIKKTGLLERNFYTKGEKELFKLFKLSNWENFHFVFAGRGWEKAWGNKYRKTGVSTHFLGELLYQDMPKFYNGIDYLLIPSRFEEGPICILEALACGKPIISRRVGLAPELKITHYDEVEELAGLLRWIEKDYVERRNQVKNLGVKEWAEKYRKLYKELVSSSENQEY